MIIKFYACPDYIDQAQELTVFHKYVFHVFKWFELIFVRYMQSE